MPKLASRITIDQAKHVVCFDGEEFPYYIAEDGVEVNNVGDPNHIPSVTLTILADDVEVLPARVSLTKPANVFNHTHQEA